MFTPPHGDSEDQAHLSTEIRKRYSISKETTLVLAVGRLAARKGHGMLLNALARVLESENAHLVIIGRGSLKKRLFRMASKLGISSNISIESEMDFREIAEMYRVADIVAYPSYYEGQGLIPLEAMASSTPVITVDHGPLPEMVDESVGRLFKMGSVISLADAIISEISSKSEMMGKGLKGRSRVLNEFNLEGNANDFLEVYERAIITSNSQGNS